MSIIEFLKNHWVEIGAAFGLITQLARLIVKLTPTPKDDSVLETVLGWLKHVGLQSDAGKPKDF